MKNEVIKQVLKRIPVANALNAWTKSRSTKRAYRATVARYANLAITSAISLPVMRENEKMRIFFLGTDEQQDRSGTIQALEKFGSVTCFTRCDGSYGQNHPGTQRERRSSNTARLIEMMRDLAGQGCSPDILIAQTWASFIDPKVFDHIRKEYGTLVVNMAMDDRHQYWGERIDEGWGGTYGLIPHIDLALTAAPECVDWYRKEGCPALFFPEASDAEIFHPMSELPKIYDVSFVGGRYGVREKIVTALRRAGIAVEAFGSGWDGGRLPVSDVPRLFALSRIILGVGTIGHCTDFYALKMRDFDGPMSGSFYLTHDNRDLSRLYDIGNEVETYRDADECIDKVRWYLAHDDLRETVAAAGRARAVSEHTWEKRFGALFDVLRGQGDVMPGQMRELG